jgi:glycosyltransferase involved in cell wall biosynthesis
VNVEAGDDPLVSVVIPMFNAGPWIREALASVAMQTHAVHECIVVSDGSTDDGPDIVRDVQRGGSLPLRLVEIEHAGVSVARNTGINDDVVAPEPRILGGSSRVEHGHDDVQLGRVPPLRIVAVPGRPGD